MKTFLLIAWIVVLPFVVVGRILYHRWRVFEDGPDYAQDDEHNDEDEEDDDMSCGEALTGAERREEFKRAVARKELDEL